MKTLWFCLTALILLTSCAAKPESTMEFSEKDQGKTVTLSPGQVLRITLVSNPTTGYDWKFSSEDFRVIALKKASFKAPDPGLCGAPGHSVQEFQAVTPGKSVICGKYIRPWEKEKAVKSYLINVIVR